MNFHKKSDRRGFPGSAEALVGSLVTASLLNEGMPSIRTSILR